MGFLMVVLPLETIEAELDVPARPRVTVPNPTPAVLAPKALPAPATNVDAVPDSTNSPPVKAFDTLANSSSEVVLFWITLVTLAPITTLIYVAPVPVP